MSKSKIFFSLLLTFLLFACRQNTYSQTNDNQEPVLVIVEQMPVYPGGETAMYKFLSSNITYPAIAKDKGISGTVIISFIVEKNGQVTNAKVLRGIGGGCDEEALRVVKSMPNWNPGKQGGKPVRVQFNLPVKFSLS